MREYLHEGWYVLAMCILAEKYTCPEKAWLHYECKVPLTVNSIGHRSWITEDIEQEWESFHKQGMSYPKIAEMYGTSSYVICRKLKKGR